jgi:hypothetical protein
MGKREAREVQTTSTHPLCEAQYGRRRYPFQPRILALLKECGKECGLVLISVAVGIGFCG